MAPSPTNIISKNKFALADNEEDVDPHELLKKNEQEREAKRLRKIAEKAANINRNNQNGRAAKPTKNLKQIQDIKKPKGQTTLRPVPSAPKSQYSGNNKNEDRPKQPSPSSSGSESGAPDKSRAERVFVRGGGRVGFDNGRKREYERRSGSDKTGVKAVDKRRSSGPYNWGYPGDEVWDATVPQEEPKKPEGSKTAESSDKATSSRARNATERTSVTFQEKRPLTLDEWRSLKSTRPKPRYNIRKPGEGEDLTRWNGMIVLSSKKENVEEEEEYVVGEYPQRVGRQVRLEIDVSFADRRGRSGGRRGSQEDDTANHSSAVLPPPAPRVDDEAAFPSLV